MWQSTFDGGFSSVLAAHLASRLQTGPAASRLHPRKACGRSALAASP
jgi:hypothetical protein